MTLRLALPISLKLLFLAGFPVAGAILLGLMLARNAQEQARSAEALGTIEDLARLSLVMSNVIHAVQDERAQTALALGQNAKSSDALPGVRLNSDQSIAKLGEFLAQRSVGSLPARLGRDLAEALEAIKKLQGARQQADDGNLALDQLLERYGKIAGSLIRATAGLTQLSNDGELLRNITVMVGALEVSERISGEQALLANVLGTRKFPPGSFRELVTLNSDRQVYLNVLRSSAADDQVRELEALTNGPAVKRANDMRQRAQELGDTEDDSLQAADWFNVENQILHGMRELERSVAARVKSVAAGKISETRAALRTSRGLSAMILFASVALALLIGRGINRSVMALAKAAHDVRANNDYSIRALRCSNDELGMLTDAFNGMLADILLRDRQLDEHRKNLEMLVQSRTAELAQRNREMRIVLDAVEEGLVTVNPDGSLGTQQSQAFGAWFPNGAGRPFFEVLAPDEPTQTKLRLGWESVVEQFLPLDVCLDQMATRLVVGERLYSLAYRPILEGDQLLAVLLSIHDITSEVARLRIEAQQREFVGVFERAVKDKNGFIEFFDEASRIVDALAAPSQTEDAVLLRLVHTLKGNSAVYGVTTVSELCHELETLAQDEDGGIAAVREQIPRIVDKWTDFSKRIVPLLGGRVEDVIEVRSDELDAIVALVERLPGAQPLLAQLQRLKYEPIVVRFERAAEQAKGFASRLGKGSIKCLIEAGGVRLPATRWSPFFQSLIHIIRNAVDHGIEPESERLAAGKAPVGTLTFTAREGGGNIVIEVADDGRGIDWSRIRAKALSMGIVCENHEDLVRALFVDGLTTRDTATEYSGRGVGMAAVRQAVAELSGRIDVRSTAGLGATFIFTFPLVVTDVAPPGSRFLTSQASLRAPVPRIES